MSITRETVEQLKETFPEINMGNYDDDDVSKLNAWGIEAYDALSAAQTRIAELTEIDEFERCPTSVGSLAWLAERFKQRAESAESRLSALTAENESLQSRLKQINDLCKASAEGGYSSVGLGKILNVICPLQQNKGGA